MTISREDQVKILYGSEKASNEAAPKPPSSESLSEEGKVDSSSPSPRKSRWAIVKTMLNFEVWQWVMFALVIMVGVLAMGNYHSVGAKVGSGILFGVMAIILPIQCKRDSRR